MNEDLRAHYEQFRHLLTEEFLPVLNRKIDRQIAFLKEIRGLQVRLGENVSEQTDQAKQVNFVGGYKEKLKAAIQKRFNIGPPASFAEEFRNYDIELERYLSTIPDVVVRKQDADRFRILRGDRFQIKLLKLVKIFFFRLSQVPRAFINLFRSNKKKAGYWSHKIFMRNLTEYYMKDELCYDLLKLKDAVYKKISATALTGWKNDEYIDDHVQHLLNGEGSTFELDPKVFDNLLEAEKEMEALRETIADDAIHILNEVFADYEHDFVRTGTIELANRTFDQSHLDRAEEGTNKHYTKHHEEWQNTFLLLCDDWGMDIDLYLIMFGTMLEYWLSVRRFDNRIDQKILYMLEPWKKELNKGLEEIKSANNAALKSTLERQFEEASGLLSDEKLEELNDLVLGQDLPSLINNIDAQVEKLISSIDSNRAISKNSDFQEPVKSGSFNMISPYELISFESYPELLKATKKVRVQITENLNKCQTNVLYLGQIVGFNLETAISLYEEDTPENDPRQIAIEGMERTIRQLNELEASFLKLQKLVDEDLLQCIRTFFERIGAFTDNENILDIRMRIVKGKAIQKSRKVNQRFIQKFHELLPHFTSNLKTQYANFKEWYEKQAWRYGFAEQDTAITAEVSDFLAESRQAIQRLPFVYQRLFSGESLSDENFFVGREAELQELHRAYNNWTKGRFAATAVVGEKGSGVTTLINFFLNGLATSSRLYRMSITGTLKTREDLLHFLNEGFGTSYTDYNDLLAFLKDEKQKKVVIIEGLQNSYMKRIGGFEAIRALTELIAHSSREVFWLVASTAYAWIYLEKTNQLNDHFGYVVRLKEFNDATINDIIRKRHKVSGYNLEFAPSIKDQGKKKFRKMTGEEKQVSLENSYFNELNKIARSNVSLALNYWLRSTKEVRDDAIVISSLKDRDMSFMNTIDGDKLYGLAALILHEGLSEDNFAQAMSISSSRARAILHPLYEDGIVVLENEQYVVNPLLYRQTINLLKSRNIIH